MSADEIFAEYEKNAKDFDFTVVNNSFEMAPPKVDDPENQRLVDKGLEGKV